jgi:hypothetical protein
MTNMTLALTHLHKSRYASSTMAEQNTMLEAFRVAIDDMWFTSRSSAAMAELTPSHRISPD